ncbi:doublecortin domain-containing protein 2B-like, partial [Scleropages formosus]
CGWPLLPRRRRGATLRPGVGARAVCRLLRPRSGLLAVLRTPRGHWVERFHRGGLHGAERGMAVSWTAPPPAKSVLVFRNGDPFHAGRRLLVRQRQGATLEAFLNEVTEVIGAPAAVRTLHTPRHGHRVRDLKELQSGAQYVAAGFERFKKLEATERLNVQLPSGKWSKTEPLPCVIHVFRNGDVLTAPLRFILPRSLQRDLEQVLRLVSERAGLLTGAVRRLCTLEGRTVASVEQLRSGQYYVAVGTEKFKKLPYVELLISNATEAGPRKPLSVPQDRFSDSALVASPEADGRRVRSTGDEAVGATPPPGRGAKQEESLFYSRPVGVRKGRAGNRPPGGNRAQNGSVFKGKVRKKRKEMQGAQEVAEDEDTAVELPVDQVLKHSPSRPVTTGGWRDGTPPQLGLTPEGEGRGPRLLTVRSRTAWGRDPHREPRLNTQAWVRQPGILHKRKSSRV